MLHCFSGIEKKNMHFIYEGSKCTVVPLFRCIRIFKIWGATKKATISFTNPGFIHLTSSFIILTGDGGWRRGKGRRRSRYLKVLRNPTLDNYKLVQIKTLLMKLWQVCPQFWNEEHVSKSIRKTHLGFPLLIYFTTFVRKLHVIINNIIIIIITQFPFLQLDLIENPKICVWIYLKELF